MRTCVSVGASVDAGAVFLCRDGDTVEIRAEADGARLHIRDNHIADEQDESPAIQGCQ
jgi:hypothetical protein